MSLEPPRLARPSLRVVSEEEESPYPKCSLLLRAGARVFDVAVAWALWVTTGQIGAVLALLFLLMADGMFGGQSAGKRLFGIKVVFLPAHTAAEYRESVLRNAPFALIILLGMMPDPLGPVAALGGVLVIGGVEAWKVVRDPLGIRLGDVWGRTQVVDGKVSIGAMPLSTGASQPAGAEGQLMIAVREERAKRPLRRAAREE